MTIQFLIIHHSATSRDKTRFAVIRKNHIAKKWGDIGYHYFIEGNGKLYKGRPDNIIGFHCLTEGTACSFPYKGTRWRTRGMNCKSIGICLSGNFQNESPSRLQLKQLKTLVLKLKKQHNISNSRVISHCDVAGASTACCGTNLKVLIRKDYWDIKPIPAPQKPPVKHDWKKECDRLHLKLIECNKKRADGQKAYSSLKISHLELAKSREKLKTKYNILTEDYGKLKEIETDYAVLLTTKKELEEDIKRLKAELGKHKIGEGKLWVKEIPLRKSVLIIKIGLAKRS